jgi:hypothetical protein
MMATALAMHIELMQENGEAIPKPAQRFQLSLDDLSEGEFCTWIKVDVPEPVATRTVKARRR